MPNGLALFKKEFSLGESQGILYGDSQGFMITVGRSEHKIELFVDARLDGVDEESVDTIRELIKNGSADYKLSSYKMDAIGISVTARERDTERLIDFAYKLLDKMQELNIPGLSVCSNCGKPIESGCGTAVRIGSHAHYCDHDCFERLKQSDKEHKSTVHRHVRGSFAGFAGALTGCIAASVLYFILGLNDWFCAFVGVLFPIFTSLGYDMLGGQRSVAKAVTVVILPILSIALITFITLCAGVYRSWHTAGYVFTLQEVLNESIEYIISGGKKGAFVLNQLLPVLIFGAAGWLFAIPESLPKKLPARIGELKN